MLSIDEQIIAEEFGSRFALEKATLAELRTLAIELPQAGAWEPETTSDGRYDDFQGELNRESAAHYVGLLLGCPPSRAHQFLESFTPWRDTGTASYSAEQFRSALRRALDELMR